VKGDASVARDREYVARHGKKDRFAAVELVAQVGLPVSAAGVAFGGQLNNAWQIAAFAGSALLGLSCLIFIAARRLR